MAVLARRVSQVPDTSPGRRLSPLVMPRGRQERGRGQKLRYTFKRRTCSLDATDSGQTPVTLPFPNAPLHILEARNVIATPSSTTEDDLYNNVTMDECIYSYLSEEITPWEVVKRRNCPTPKPIPSVTPNLEAENGLLQEKIVAVLYPKSPPRVRNKPVLKVKTLRFPRIARNTPSPFRALTRCRRPSPLLYDRRTN